MTRTALFSRKQPGGVFDYVSIYNVQGDAWFVDSGHSLASDSAGLIAWAAEHVPLPGAELVVADMGCGPGNNSALPVMAAARALQRRLDAAGGAARTADSAPLR